MVITSTSFKSNLSLAMQFQETKKCQPCKFMHTEQNDDKTLEITNIIMATISIMVIYETFKVQIIPLMVMIWT